MMNFGGVCMIQFKMPVMVVAQDGRERNFDFGFGTGDSDPFIAIPFAMPSWFVDNVRAGRFLE